MRITRSLPLAVIAAGLAVTGCSSGVASDSTPAAQHTIHVSVPPTVIVQPETPAPAESVPATPQVTEQFVTDVRSDAGTTVALKASPRLSAKTVYTSTLPDEAHLYCLAHGQPVRNLNDEDPSRWFYVKFGGARDWFGYLPEISLNVGAELIVPNCPTGLPTGLGR